jgi:hypothetical protein
MIGQWKKKAVLRLFAPSQRKLLELFKLHDHPSTTSTNEEQQFDGTCGILCGVLRRIAHHNTPEDESNCRDIPERYWEFHCIAYMQQAHAGACMDIELQLSPRRSILAVQIHI